MSDSVQIRTRKFIRNPLLARRQMVVDVIHPGKANVPRKELQESIGKMYKSKAENVVIFGNKTKFGGGSSTMFCLVYDTKDAMLKFEVSISLNEKYEKEGV